MTAGTKTEEGTSGTAAETETESGTRTDPGARTVTDLIETEMTNLTEVLHEGTRKGTGLLRGQDGNAPDPGLRDGAQGLQCFFLYRCMSRLPYMMLTQHDSLSIAEQLHA